MATKYKWSFVSVSLCVCSVFVLYRFRAVCAHCVCVLVVCSVRAYLHKGLRFTLTDYALCGICGFLDFFFIFTEKIHGDFSTHKAVSHTSQGPPLFLIVVTSLPSRLARRPSAHVSLSAGSRYAQLADDTHSHSSQHAGTRYQVAHTHASQEAATLVAT